jgi:hypothetical protein
LQSARATGANSNTVLANVSHPGLAAVLKLRLQCARDCLQKVAHLTRSVRSKLAALQFTLQMHLQVTESGVPAAVQRKGGPFTAHAGDFALELAAMQHILGSARVAKGVATDPDANLIL